ncbi:conserved hypothetical protein [Candidatus Brocadia pituitae]|nr:conserved hypothetical protein [Candidatus Brocadia pituitae]
MLNNISYFIFLYCSVFGIATVNLAALADEGTQVSVKGQGFDTKNFFHLEDVGFKKDRVDFNKGWLGIFMENAEGKGVLVKEITQGSPAAEAGLKAGDIITKINDESTLGTDDLNLIQFKKTIEVIGAGGIPALTIFRDNTESVFHPRLFGKLLKNVTEPDPSFISKTGHKLTKKDENTLPLSLPSQGGKGQVGYSASKKETNMYSVPENTGPSFIKFAIKNEKYKDMLDATVQRIGEESYVREGFQSNADTNPFRLSLINYLFLHAFDTPKIGEGIIDTFCKKDLRSQIDYAAALLDVKDEQDKGVVNKASGVSPDAEPLKEMEKTDSLQKQLQMVIDSLPSVVSLVKEAFRDLSKEEFDFLYQNTHKVWIPNERIESHDLARVLALSQKVDLAKLFKATLLLLSKLSLATDEQGIAERKKTYLGSIQTNLSPFCLPASLLGARQPAISDEACMPNYHAENMTGARRGDVSTDRISSSGLQGKGGWGTELLQDFTGDILIVQDTRIGKIVVGGRGTSYYYADAAIIIDLGGNDYYFNNAGASSKDVPVSLCIDFSGDDTYQTDAPFTQGTGRFGIGLLIDYQGNDQYSSKDFSQGACLFGVGLLLDIDGKDYYNGHVINQGVGCFGAGLLSDTKGNDVYFSRQFAQGVGFTKGFGALIDADGDDYYFAGGVYPDFRDPGRSYQSMSQGIGMGIRPEETIVGASGGVGMLVDQKGTDTYHGDYFSQGSGYYFSLGLLYDRNGNDRYYAGRYAQGTGIHSAIGFLKDTSGDDAYECTFGVSQGCGHDTGIGFLVDDYGNDTYRSKTTSQGVGLEKGIGILADFFGNDMYDANDHSQGVSLLSKTEDILGIGILIDNQGNHDVFHDTIAENLLLYRPNGGLVLNK